jgi:hypothetical protein
MSNDSISSIARVECRSEGRVDETPVAVLIGRERSEIIDVLDRAVIAGVEAGSPVKHRLWVELEDGRRCELTRIAPDGAWRVRIEISSGSGSGAG